jgi:hypothetical protein
MFTEDKMVAWENKTAAQQTWQNLQDYFTEKLLEQRQYSQATARPSHFKDPALAAQELAAAEEEGKSTVMMFTLLQEQHKAQLKSMVAANQQAMDTMFECMNALTGCAPSITNHNKKRCTNCSKLVFHKPETCYKIKTNTSKCYTGWKSSKNTSVPV